MGDVILLEVETTLPIPVERVLDGARDQNLSLLMVIGRNVDGQLYAASSHGDVGNLLLLMERAKAALLEGG